ncbi:hypothetical protein PC9H_010742 [Pleurotus ostreatus]|uniref:Protein kinase domain-containing protein n=2 Tax=Pleurotus TaxID=5320 RepID=A0A8H6ZND9_PLEOS|nr:uncharacterized protein PC9H_010742 [Pleurotus ostreatus]KAF7422586.1 hypothetical protein PC9H_010742 [Pleurotus ostreatus]KAG9227553.1 hypothetical protein CCMSSC00406_0000801 [Pleurotus cornucopiae]KAJ8691545.1 hypothetical protein PTI98_011107 [Pleurotus ostreatus]
MAQSSSTDVPSPSAGAHAEGGKLLEHELFWRDHYDWLLSRGYHLRSRYKPDWKPSWEGTKKFWAVCTDGIMPKHPSVLDAERESDGELLMLKRVQRTLHPHEAVIGQFFSSSPVVTDPSNHCIPIYEVLEVPDDKDVIILVMPLLRRHDSPTFDTVGEAIEFFRQVFEGLQFMHRHHVAHRDAAALNIMMDARTLYIDRYHPSRPNSKIDINGAPRHYTRTQVPVKYYFTDFGLSRQYKPENLPVTEEVIYGADKTVPEFETLESCDPFPTDVYTLGNMIREEFIEGSRFDKRKLGFDFMKPLVADMTQADPTKRPTMDEVVERFEKIRKDLTPWKLRSRVVEVPESPFSKTFRNLGHWKRRIWFMARRVPPVPAPS